MLQPNLAAIQNFDSDLYGTLTIFKDEENREFFRAIDVCCALRHGNPSQTLSRLVDDEYVIQVNDGTNRGGLVNYLSEPGLYQLLFASKTAIAKNFQKWVLETVLPKLRASGGYVMPNATSDQLVGLQAEISNLQKALTTVERSRLQLINGHCLIDYSFENIKNHLSTENSGITTKKLWTWVMDDSQVKDFLGSLLFEGLEARVMFGKDIPPHTFGSDLGNYRYDPSLQAWAWFELVGFLAPIHNLKTERFFHYSADWSKDYY